MQFYSKLATTSLFESLPLKVCGTAELNPRAHKYACKVLLGYPGTDVPEIPTRLTFEVREVTVASERLCYLSLVWGEAGSRLSGDTTNCPPALTHPNCYRMR